MSAQSGYPNITVLSTEKPTYKKYYVGDTSILVYIPPESTTDSKIIWEAGTFTVLKPDGSTADSGAVTPEDNKYIVSFAPDVAGWWEVRIKYGRAEPAGEAVTKKFELRVVAP